LLVAGVEISDAATSKTIYLNNSSGNPITTGATLKYYDGGWQTAIDQGDGSFTASVNGTSIMYTMTYKLRSQTITTSDPIVTFATVSTTALVKDSDGHTLTGGTFSYYGSGWSASFNSGDLLELLPGNYSVSMKYNNSGEQKNGQTVSGTSTEIVFTTTTVTPRLMNCTNTEDVPNSTFTYYGNQGWKANQATNTSIEILPGNFSFSMSVNGTSKQTNGIAVSGASQDIIFNATLMNYVYGGNITYYSNGWRTLTQGMYLMAGTYYFNFGNIQFTSFAVSGCTMEGNVNIFKTVKHDGTPLPNIPIARNHYYSSYTPVGTTDANGILFTSDQPTGNNNGIWKYKATKDNSIQYIISGPNNIKFQTSEFVTHVMHTDNSPFEGIKTEYNHYYSSYMGMSSSTTDASGNASIELFPGEYKFKATKDFSVQYKELEILLPGTSATVNFQTSTFVTHVMDHNGNPFGGIKTEYNHYYSSYMGLSPSTTDASGNASIELFPGNYKFKATKDNSVQTEMLNIPASGLTASVDFQTALAEAHVKDCELNTGVEGVTVEYNHYYSSYMGLSPSVTTASGIASIELFPGTYKFKATKHNSSEVKTVAIAGPVTTFEFNPTRVTFNYPGTVKYNHYYSSYMTIGANTYLFPGTYNFRFYNGNTLATQQSIAISGCSMNQALIFVQLKNSLGAGLAGGDFDYRYGSGNYSNLGLDNTGNGYWAFINGNPTNAEVKVKYGGTSFSKTQNVKVTPVFTFNTVNVTAGLFQSDDATEITSGTTWQYRYGSGSYYPLTNSGTELLPVNTEVKVGYGGTTVNKSQNVGTAGQEVFRFNTVNVTAGLFQSDDATEITSGTTWQYRYGSGSYYPLTNSGTELLPVNTEVKVGYSGTSVNKSQNVGTAGQEVFRFNTKKVTAELYESTNTSEITSGTTWQYRYGSGSYYPLTNTGTELLPVYTEVKVGYGGTSVNKSQNVGTAGQELFHFNTVNVTADLMYGATDLSGSATWQYRYGSGSYYPLTNSGTELLPVYTEVKVGYSSTSKSKFLNVGTTPDFHFTWNGSALGKSTSEDFGGVLTPVKVYPNPSEGKFMIENITNYFRLSVYDMTGRVVYQSDINTENNKNIVLDNPVPGAYMIQLEGVGTTVTTPIMIK
jgi:hypothetical protein